MRLSALFQIVFTSFFEHKIIPQNLRNSIYDMEDTEKSNINKI